MKPRQWGNLHYCQTYFRDRTDDLLGVMSKKRVAGSKFTSERAATSDLEPVAMRRRQRDKVPSVDELEGEARQGKWTKGASGAANPSWMKEGARVSF